MKFNKTNAKKYGRLGGIASGIARKGKKEREKEYKIFETLKAEKYTGLYKINGFVHEFVDGEETKVILNYEELN